MSAVAAIRAAALDVFLTTEAQAAVAAIARYDPYCCLVDKFHSQ